MNDLRQIEKDQGKRRSTGKKGEMIEKRRWLDRMHKHFVNESSITSAQAKPK
jgi:hypothetical protein